MLDFTAPFNEFVCLIVFNNVLANIVKQQQKQDENKHCDYMQQV